MTDSMKHSGSGSVVRGVWWVQEVTEPNWEALEEFVVGTEARAVGLEPSAFMWMAEVLLSTGVVIQLYKHTVTRRYLNLGDGHCAYWDSGDGYLQHACLEDAVAGLGLAL